MNYVLSIVSVSLIAACFVYMIRRKEKNIATFVLSGLILLTMLAQIGLDEYTRVQMLRLDGLQEIRRTAFWIQVLDWAKGILIIGLAIQVVYNQTKQFNENELVQSKEEHP